MGKYELIVGNIGRVFESNNLKDCMKKFRHYVTQSKSGVGRAGGESIILLREGEPIEEYQGTLDKELA